MAEAQGWSVMAETEAFTVREWFGSVDGRIVVDYRDGRVVELPKTAEPTWAEGPLYLGRALADVQQSEHDVLGRALLAEPGDPSFERVARVLVPVTLSGTGTYTFVGTAHSPDKVGVEYGGKAASFDPAAHLQLALAAREAGRVLDGLVGGYAPVLRFVYPDAHMADRWDELVLFASLRRPENPAVQPAWYRVARVVGGQLESVEYFDTYEPSPPRDGSLPAEAFWEELLDVVDATAASFDGAMGVTLPDRRLADLARHGLVRAAITRIDGHPKYGVMDRLYGGTEHDGFQDTFNADLTAVTDWGLADRARAIADDYLGNFVRDDGSILYRGPELGQYGRMLTAIAQYVRTTGDRDLLVRHRSKLDGIVGFLAGLQDEGPGGLIVGWCEADSCLELDPDRYRLPYTSNSAEVARGFLDLGAVLGDEGLVARGARLRADLQAALEVGTLRGLDPPFLPVIAGVAEPFHVAVAADDHDPQFRAYRANMELLFSGMLTPEQVGTVIAYREAHRDLVLGVPLAYGYTNGPELARNTPEFATFLSYGHGYGLLLDGRRREFLLLLWSLAAHAVTRGSWTAPETRRIDPGLPAAGYAVPAQLSIPMLVRWMLVLEHPTDDVLYLGRGIPAAWLDDVVIVDRAPTRWGPVSFRIDHGTWTIDAPAGPRVVLPPGP